MKVMGTAAGRRHGGMTPSGRHRPYAVEPAGPLPAPGPHGGGTTRRRASDAVRVGLATVLVVICVALAQANTSVEIHVTELITPPPSGIHWLITALWFVGSIGVIVALVLIGLLVPRLTAVRQMGVAGLAALVVCLLLDALLGPAAGRPPIPEFAGFDPRFPIVQLAVATAVALAGLPYLSRPMHRIVIGAMSIAALCAVVGAYGLPLGVIAGVIVGWGTAAACHLAMGAPNGLPSASEVTDAVRDLQVEVHGLTSMPRQEWGVAAFAGTDADGRAVELAVYGRDAADAQWLRKVWRFCIYRDSGPTLVINRLQQVEHEAYLTLLAAHAGTLVPEIVAAGRCGPAHDAALVTRLPEGRRLSALSADEVSDDDLDGFLRSVLVLRKAGISHGALSPETVLTTPEGPLLRDFRRASSSAPAMRTDRDLAAAVAAAAVVVGVDRAVAATCRVLDAETIRAVLTRLQRSTLDPETERMARTQKGFLKTLRESLATAAGVEVPKLVEAKRISWPNLLMVIGSLVGLWLIIGVLTEASGSLERHPRRRLAMGGRRVRPGAAPRRHRRLGAHRRRHRPAALRALRRPGDVEPLHVVRRRRRRRLRRARALLPTPGARRAGGHQLGGHRRHRQLGGQGRAVHRVPPLRRRRLPQTVDIERERGARGPRLDRPHLRPRHRRPRRAW